MLAMFQSSHFPSHLLLTVSPLSEAWIDSLVSDLAWLLLYLRLVHRNFYFLYCNATNYICLSSLWIS